MSLNSKKLPRLFAVSLFLSGLVLTSCSNDNSGPTDNTPKPAIEAIERPQAAVKTNTTAASRKSALPVNGAKLYNRCAACHMKTGEGVVGAFPPLKGELAQLLNSDLGKEYFALVAMYGLAGEIEVAGETYSGMMTAQGGMTSEKTAAVLNHIMQSFNDVSKEDPRLFTAEFVTDTKTKYGRLSGSKVYELRDAAYESVLP